MTCVSNLKLRDLVALVQANLQPEDIGAVNTLNGTATNLELKGNVTLDNQAVDSLCQYMEECLVGGMADDQIATDKTWSSYKIRNEIATAINALINNADQDEDTLKELADKIRNIGALSTQDRQRLDTLADKVDDMAELSGSYVTQDQLSDSQIGFATKDELNKAIRDLVNGADADEDTLKELADKILALAQADNGLVSASESQSFNESQKQQARDNIDAAAKSDIPDVSGFATKDEIPDVSGFATKDEIPDVSGFATKEEVANLPLGLNEAQVRAIIESYDAVDTAEQGPTSAYNGFGWFKATDTGIVYNTGVLDGETHKFEGDPKEYISVYTKADAKRYANRAATSNITDMSGLFKRDTTNNPDISHWDVSNVVSMREMFNRSIFNQDISNWDVSNVEDMYGMFYNNQRFDQDLSQWCVAKIAERPDFFDSLDEDWAGGRPQWGYCPRGENGNPTEPVNDQGPLSEYSGTGWWKDTDTGIVYNKDVPEGETHTFEGDPKEYISVYTKEDARQYAERAATSNMTDMSNLFSKMIGFNEEISHWDTSNVTDMSYMFFKASDFNQSVSNFDTSKVTNMDSMFNYASKFNQPVDNFDTSKVTNMRAVFASSSFNQPLDNFDTSNVTDFGFMFFNALKFNQPLSHFDTSKAIDMEAMFDRAIIFNQDLSQWCVSQFSSSPNRFDERTQLWTLPKPVWGTCPRGEDQS